MIEPLIHSEDCFLQGTEELMTAGHGRRRDRIHSYGARARARDFSGAKGASKSDLRLLCTDFTATS